MIEYKTVRWLYQQVKPLRLSIMVLALLSIILSFTRVSFISYSKNVIDEAMTGNLALLNPQLIRLVFFTLAQVGLRLLIPALEDWLQVQVETLFRNQMMRKLFSKKYVEVKRLATGEWLTRFFSDIEITSSGVVTLIPYFLRISVNLILSFFLLYQLQPQLAGVILFAGCLLFIVSYFFRRQFKSLHKTVQATREKLQVYLQEVLMNLLVIKTYQSEKQKVHQLDKLQASYAKVRKKRRHLSILNSLGIQGSIQIGYLLIIGLGSISITQGTMTYGTLLALMQLVNNLITPISNLSGLTSRYFALIGSSERLMDLEEMQDERGAEEREHEILDFSSLSFDQVGFSYKEDREVLSQVSFSVGRGEMLALTGPSGMGKSTLFYLMLGLYEPQAGNIMIRGEKEGLSYQDTSLSSIRDLFAYVPQGHGLFSGTIRENLLVGQIRRTDEAIWQALDRACAGDFVRSLPNQLEQSIGEQGKALSEGQQQRLAIARALLSQAPILLFDEATSAVDEVTEKEVLSNIASLMDKTCIIVTHRPAALAFCQRQLVLENGRLREMTL